MLNGWQRIWVILSAIFLILLGLILFETMPTEDDIYKPWSYDLIELSLTLKEFQGLHIWDVRDKYKDLTNQEIIKRVQSKFSDTESGTAESGQTADSGQTTPKPLSGEKLKRFKRERLAAGDTVAEINQFLVDTEMGVLVQEQPEQQQYTLDFTEINNEHNSRLNNLTNAQVTTISMYFGIWLAIIVCLYVFGWSIGWVIRGFKNKNS